MGMWSEKLQIPPVHFGWACICSICIGMVAATELQLVALSMER
jgi:hypothetical protein